MLALVSLVAIALLMVRRPPPACPASKVRMPPPTCVDMSGEPPSPNNVPERLDEGRPEMMAYTPRVPSLLTETTYWDSPSLAPSQSEDWVEVYDEQGQP